MAVSELPGNPNAVWTVKTHSQGNYKINKYAFVKMSRTNFTNDRKL